MVSPPVVEVKQPSHREHEQQERDDHSEDLKRERARVGQQIVGFEAVEQGREPTPTTTYERALAAALMEKVLDVGSALQGYGGLRSNDAEAKALLQVQTDVIAVVIEVPDREILT